MKSERGSARSRRRGSFRSPGRSQSAHSASRVATDPHLRPRTSSLQPRRTRHGSSSPARRTRSRHAASGSGAFRAVYNNFITYDTERLLEQARAESIEADVRLANAAARFASIDVDAETRRKLDQLRLGLTLPAPQTDGAAAELAQITTRLASTYSKGRIDLDGVSTTLDELEVQMREVRDRAKLEEMWTQWREVAKPMAAD